MLDRTHIVMVVSGIALAACSSSTGGSLAGTIGGESYAIADAISAPVTTSSSTGIAVILMSTDTDLCTRIGTKILHPNEKLVLIELADSSGTATTIPMAPSDFTIYSTGSPPPHEATLGGLAYDATCTAIGSASASASGGTITLTSISGNVFDGHFDVTMATGDHVTGSFSPASCPNIQSELTSTGQPICM